MFTSEGAGIRKFGSVMILASNLENTARRVCVAKI
jgi:hypothetical protein